MVMVCIDHITILSRIFSQWLDGVSLSFTCICVIYLVLEQYLLGKLII